MYLISISGISITILVLHVPLIHTFLQKLLSLYIVYISFVVVKQSHKHLFKTENCFNLDYLLHNATKNIFFSSYRSTITKLHCVYFSILAAFISCYMTTENQEIISQILHN